MAAEKRFSIVGLMVRGLQGEVEELVTSDEPHLTHLFEFQGENGEYSMYGIYPRGAVRQGYASINPGRVNYFVVTLETPVEGQMERTFTKRLGELLQAKKLRLVPWKDGTNPMVSMVNRAGKEAGLQPFMQPGDIEEFQTLPEPGEGQAHLTKGMAVSKPSGYWTVAVSAPSAFHGSNANYYLKQIVAAFEETAAPMIQQGLLHFYRLVNKITSKTVKEEWSEQGKQRAASEKDTHQQAVNYLYHLAETAFRPYSNLHHEFLRSIQWRFTDKPDDKPVVNVSLQTNPTIQSLMGDENPTFRLAIQALRRMDTEEFQLLDRALGIYRRKMEKAGSTAEKSAADHFLMVFGSLHYADNRDQIDSAIERLVKPEDVGFLLAFGDIKYILDNTEELREVGYGSVVDLVKHAASQGLEALTTEPSKGALQQLAHDAEALLTLRGVVEIPLKLEEFLRQAVEQKNQPRPERRPESQVKRPPKATQGKAGTGMSYDSVEAYLRMSGLTPIAGGTKYAYWGLSGTPANQGTFIRLAAKTVRLVERRKAGRKISDFGVTDEAYYGKLTPELVDTLIAAVKRRSSPD